MSESVDQQNVSREPKLTQQVQVARLPNLASELHPETPSGPSGPPNSPPKATIVERWEKITLYSFFGVFLGLMFIFLGNELATQEGNFQQGADLAKDVFEKTSSNPESASYRPDVSLLYTFEFSSALEAAHLKTAAVILGTVIVCLGCIIVVYGVEASYQLTVNPGTPANPSSLNTSSPGLVLITLGVLVIVVAQFNYSKFNTNVDWIVPKSKASATPPMSKASPTPTEGPNAHPFPTPPPK